MHIEIFRNIKQVFLVAHIFWIEDVIFRISNYVICIAIYKYEQIILQLILFPSKYVPVQN